ncbi:MAG: DNA-directed RNA polymerase subunit K [Nanoarchaeota archaeon]|nr:DNA-directed RNA polymerase subunit K [Nanoarchaeota archaeon]
MKKEEFTKYEKARMLGSRSLQIAMVAPFLVKLSKEQLEKIGYDSLAIAKMEFEQGVLPITVKRPMPIPEGIEQRDKEAA